MLCQVLFVASRPLKQTQRTAHTAWCPSEVCLRKIFTLEKTVVKTKRRRKLRRLRFNHENDVLSWENWEAGASLLALGSASVGTSARTPSGFFRSQVCWFVSLFCTFKSFDYKKNYSDSYFFKVFLKHSFF